jgi:hypothetical protein
MVKRIKQMFEVLKEPENLIVTMGVLVSASLAYLGIRNNDIQQALTAILAILGALAIAQIVAGYATVKRDKQVGTILSLLQKSDVLHLSPSQREASQELIALVERDKPKKADLIELSTATIDDLLESLKRENCQIRLLMQSPDCAITNYQKDRIQQRIRDLMNVTLREYTRSEIRLYAVPCSIRGRLIGESVINIGWYTYSNDEIGAYGHDNPLVTARVDTPEGRELCRMFQRAFDWLWGHKKTITLDKTMEQMTDENV